MFIRFCCFSLLLQWLQQPRPRIWSMLVWTLSESAWAAAPSASHRKVLNSVILFQIQIFLLLYLTTAEINMAIALWQSQRPLLSCHGDFLDPSVSVAMETSFMFRLGHAHKNKNRRQVAVNPSVSCSTFLLRGSIIIIFFSDGVRATSGHICV